MRDDRVFPETRLLGAVIVPFLLVAFALLYFFPEDTRPGSPGTCSPRSRR